MRPKWVIDLTPFQFKKEYSAICFYWYPYRAMEISIISFICLKIIEMLIISKCWNEIISFENMVKWRNSFALFKKIPVSFMWFVLLKRQISSFSFSNWVIDVCTLQILMKFILQKPFHSLHFCWKSSASFVS